MVLQITQIELEARAMQIMQSNPDPNQLVSRIFGPLENWVMELGPYKLMLIPWTLMWWQFDRAHGAWEPTGIKAGTVEFVLVGEEIEARPVEVRAPEEAPVATPRRSGPKEPAKQSLAESPEGSETVPTTGEVRDEPAYGAATVFEIKPLIWRLRFLSGPRADEKVTLAEKLSLGREVDNDVVLLDPKVSRHHAVIQRQDDTYVLNDLGSRNGTFLNGQRLIAPALLKKEDLISIGGSDIAVNVA